MCVCECVGVSGGRVVGVGVRVGVGGWVLVHACVFVGVWVWE